MPGSLVERGDRIALRTVERDDAAFLARGRNHPDVRYSLGTLTPHNESETEEWIENRVESDDNVSVVVCLADEDDGPDDGATAIGAVDVMHVDHDRPGLAYWLRPEYQGEGYGREAVDLVVDLVFRTYDVHGVQAVAYDFNDASRGLLESLGFVEEGRAREDRFIEGEYRDAVHYGLLRREWEA